MKLKGNGGYQIIDFEGTAPATLDAVFLKNTIARGKPLWVNNLVVDGETYSGVASAKLTELAIILTLATITITIALADGSVTLEPKTYIHTICADVTYDFGGGEETIVRPNTIIKIVSKRKEALTGSLSTILTQLADEYGITHQEKPSCIPLVFEDSFIFEHNSTMCFFSTQGFEWNYDSEEEDWNLLPPYSSKVYKITDGTEVSALYVDVVGTILYDIVTE